MKALMRTGIMSELQFIQPFRTAKITSIGLSPVPVTVTTRIITFIGGDPYKPSFATVTGRGTTQLINLFFFLLVKIAYRSGMFFQKIQRHVCDFWLVTGVH